MSHRDPILMGPGPCNPYPEVIEASVGRNARSIGAATLPLMSRFFLNQQGFA